MSTLCQALLIFLAEVYMLCLNDIGTADAFLCHGGGSYFPDPNDCRKFYYCHGKTAYHHTCPSHRPLFNATLQDCINATVFCSTTVRPSPTPSRQSGGLSPSVKMSPSSTVSIYYTRYTPLSTQVGSLLSTSTVSVSTTLKPPVHQIICRSMPLEKRFTCFKNEANISRERLKNGTSTMVIREILKATAHDAEVVIDGLGSRENSSTAFNAFEVIAVLEDVWKDVIKRLKNRNETIRITTETFAVLETARISGAYEFPGPIDQASTYMALPQKLLSEDKYPCRTFGALYWNLHSVVPVRMNGTNRTLRLNSHVISMRLCVPLGKSSKSYVTIVMKHIKVLKDNDFTYCAYWDFSLTTVHGKGAWSRDGCHVITEGSNRTHTACACDHLTNFAVLMGSEEVSLSEANQFALMLITYVGCGLSLLGSVAAIASLVLFTQLNTDRHIIHGNLLISIAISQTIFLAGIEQTRNKLQCKFTAIMLHYFYLVTFGWMLCEGLHIYSMVIKVFNVSSKIYHYTVLAWGVPALIVMISVASRYSDYGTKTSCWISTEGNTVLAFIIPVTGTILANLVILALVLKEICRLQTSQRTCMSEIVRSTIKSLVVLFPLLGITWLFGLLVFATHDVTIQYLFALSNSLQGFFIFLLHCLFNSEIRKTFKRKKEIWKTLKVFAYFRKRIFATSVVPVGHRSSLTDKVATFKVTSEQ
ncbi:adhesion G-protein coupled receptor D1-like [Porites lutea]|uniref:adhesion G-protein coupled receptor D1-like n=1 Tax=Porites lutea TaxID=51062 RepID=UPI003CC54EC4